MARIRTIKPELWTSEQFAECSTAARLAFVGLLNFCDDHGLHPDKPRRLKLEVFAGDDLTGDDVAGFVVELVDAGLVERVTCDGQPFLHVTGWQHQRIDRPNFKHPVPDGYEPDPAKPTVLRRKRPDARRPFDERSTNDRRSVDEQSSNDRRSIAPVRESKVRDSKVGEGKGANVGRSKRADQGRNDPPTDEQIVELAASLPESGHGYNVALFRRNVIDAHMQTGEGFASMLTQTSAYAAHIRSLGTEGSATVKAKQNFFVAQFWRGTFPVVRPTPNGRSMEAHGETLTGALAVLQTRET